VGPTRPRILYFQMPQEDRGTPKGQVSNSGPCSGFCLAGSHEGNVGVSLAEEIYLPGRNLKRRRMAGGGADSATALLHSAVWTDDTQDLDWSMVMNQFGLNAISPPGDGHCQFRVFCLLFWRLTDDSAVMAMRNYLHHQFTQFEKDFRELIPFAFNSSNLKSQLLCSTSVQWGDVLTLWVAALTRSRSHSCSQVFVTKQT